MGLIFMCKNQKTKLDGLQTVEVLLYGLRTHAKNMGADLVYLFQVTWGNQL